MFPIFVVFVFFIAQFFVYEPWWFGASGFYEIQHVTYSRQQTKTVSRKTLPRASSTSLCAFMSPAHFSMSTFSSGCGLEFCFCLTFIAQLRHYEHNVFVPIFVAFYEIHNFLFNFKQFRQQHQPLVQRMFSFWFFILSTEYMPFALLLNSYFGFEWRQCYHNKRYEMAQMLNMWWNRIKLTSPIVNKYMAMRKCSKTVDERDTLEWECKRQRRRRKKKAFVHRVLWCGEKWLAKIIGCARAKCKKHRVESLSTFIHEFGLSACEAHTHRTRQTALHLTDDCSFSNKVLLIFFVCCCSLFDVMRSLWCAAKHINSC